MNRLERKTVWNTVILAGLFLYAYFAGRLARNTENVFWNSVLSLSRHLIHLGMITYWFISIRQRIVSKTIRRYLLWAAALIGFWLYIRTVKWMFLEDGTLCRYIWYAYYIPLILIPLFGVFIIQCIGKQQDYQLPDKIKLLYIPALLLLVLIFTNDVHQQVFGFPHGIAHYNDQYTYQIGYFLTLLWCVCLGLYFAVMLLVKSRAPGKPWSRRFPFVVLIVGVILTILYCLRVVVFDMTAVNCFLIVLLLEGSIQSGLIRSNSMYDALFSSADIDASITDQDGNICFASKLAEPITPILANRLKNESVIKNKKRLNRASISKGYVYWWDDISGILRDTEELEKTGRYLEEKNDLLKAELALQEKQLAISEKNRLYDRVAKDSAPQLKKLEELLNREELLKGSSDAETKKCLAHICVLCAYIKRRSNLVLLAETSSVIAIQELEYAFRELLDNIRLTGTTCASVFQCSGTWQTEIAVALLDACQEVVSQQLFCMDSLLLRLQADQKQIHLRLQIDSEEKLLPKNSQTWEAYGGKSEVRREEDTVWISFTLTKVKGEGADVSL